LLKSIENLSSGNFRKSHPSKEFAFADLVSLVTVLDVFRNSIHSVSGWYSEESKIRDSKILLRMLINRFFSSLHKLSDSEQSIKEIIQLVLELREEESLVSDCFVELEGKL
jgi:hypothetical protein